MRGSWGMALLAFGTGVVLAGVAAFSFGRGFPQYRFHALDMGFDSYCFLGTLLIGSGAILFVIGALLHFHPPAGAIPAPAGSPLAAALLIASLVAGVCLAVGNGSGPAGGLQTTPTEAARLQSEMLQRQQEALKRLQPLGPAGFGQ